MRRPPVPVPQAARSRRPGSLALLALAVTLGVSGCGSATVSGVSATPPTQVSSVALSTPAPTPASTPTASPSPTAATTPGRTPAASRTPSPPAQAPIEVVDAGTVTDRKSASATGSGPANLAVTRKGAGFAVVVRVDCSRCRGPFVLTAPKRESPYGRSTAPLRAEYLLGVTEDESALQSLQLNVKGPWKVTFLSWNRLPVETGKQSGQGSRVLYLGDRVHRLRVTYKPAGQGDSFGGRLFTTSNEPLLFGNDHAFAETYQANLPAVLAISTNGSWTLTPKK